jgi:hypothetical protein
MADIQGLLDSFFLTRQNPVTGMLTTDEQEKLRQQQLIGTGIGVATGLASNYNKGPLGAILGAYTGGVSGRQAPVDTALKNYMTTGELNKMTQDLRLGQFNLKDKERFEAGLADAIKKDPDLANAYFVDAKGTLERRQKSDPRFRALGEIKSDELLYYNALGIDPSKATVKDKQDVLRLSTAIPDKDVFSKEVERADFMAKNKGITTLAPVISQSQMLQQILKERSSQEPSTGFAKEAQPQGQPTGQPSAQPTGKPTAQPSGKPVPLIDDPNQISDIRIDLKKSKAGDTNLAVKSIQDLSRQERIINDILNSKGFNQAFGFGGATSSSLSGSDAAYTKRLRPIKS